MTNLEKIAKVFEELGCTVRYDIDDEKYIEVCYEMTTDTERTEGARFIAHLDPLAYNIDELDLVYDINWKEELETLFNFEDELEYIEDDFCRYYMESLLDFKSICAHNVEFIVHEWYDEIGYIRADFEEFCNNFERLIKKYTKED